ncbi:hypothetical protein AGMMS4956_16770 [Bacteroidia bacterium]|nr:hypothetical protein AGMMS4956_16720 [Bacteroidia bacterium]GHT15847.1 hypothetical protein AGMMS4956_16770 [Bacteroidia bacterium]
MEHKNKVTSLQEFFDWINNSETCCVTEQDSDYFVVEAPNNADVYVHYDEDDGIEIVVAKTIEKLRDFDADERFTELWEPAFVAQNHFRPSQFIKMLQEDAETFRELAGDLAEL